VQQWKKEVWFPGRQDFSLHHNVQTSFGAHPAFYPVGTGVFSSRVKRPRHEA
jgi:hypothetical protein